MDRPVSEIMTRDVVALGEQETLLDVAQDMERHHLRHLPVVTDGKLVGLVSHRDLLRFTSSELGQADVEQMRRTLVREVMTKDVETVDSATSVLDVVHKLVAARFGCLPVIDSEGRLAGIVSEHDLLKVLAGVLTDEESAWSAAKEARSPSLVDRERDSSLP